MAPSSDTITSSDFTSFAANTLIRSAQVNANFGIWRGHILPVNTASSGAVNNTYDLGSSTYSWRNLYVAGTATIATASITGTATIGTLSVTGNGTITGNLGIGSAASADLYIAKTTSGSGVLAQIYNTSNTASSDAYLYLVVGGTSSGDPWISFRVVSGTDWGVGVDNSDSDKFKISKNAGLGTNDYLSISTTGAATFSGAVTASSTFDVTGNFAVNTNKFTVTASSGNTVVAGTLSSTGNFAVNTNKLFANASSGSVGLGTTSPDTLLDVRGEVSVLFSATYGIRFYNEDRNNWSFIGNSVATGSTSANLRLGDNSGMTITLVDGNVGIKTATFGTSAVGVLGIKNGTAPTTGPADTIQIYSVDLSAGNTIPAIFTEGTGIVSANATTTNLASRIAMKVNGTVYYLLAASAA